MSSPGAETVIRLDSGVGKLEDCGPSRQSAVSCRSRTVDIATDMSVTMSLDVVQVPTKMEEAVETISKMGLDFYDNVSIVMMDTCSPIV